MSNRFSDVLARVSVARSALSRIQTAVAPVLASNVLDDVTVIGDVLANIETELKAASNVLDSALDSI